MKSPYQALLWEQMRICGPICLAVFGVFVVTLIAGYFGDNEHYGPWGLEGSEVLIILLQVVAAVLIVLRREGRKKRGLGFESRHLALPLSTFKLVLIILSARILCILALSTAVIITLFKFTDITGLAGYAVMPLLFYLALQSWAWVIGPIRGAVCLGGIALLFAFPYGEMYLSSFYTDGEYLYERVGTSSLTPLIVGLPAFLLAFFGVSCQRWDRQSRISTLYDMYVWLVSLFAPQARIFMSPLNAQIWYERRRVGRQLFLLFPILLLLISWFYLLIFDDTEKMPIIFVALFLGAFIVGTYGLKTSSFVLSRPVPVQVFTYAKLLAQAYALFLGLCLLAVFLTLNFLFSDFQEYQVMEALNKGVIDVLYVVAIILRPLLIAGFLAWLASWLSTRLMALTLIVLVNCALILNMLEERHTISAMPLAYAVFVIYLWCFLGIGIGWRRHYLSSRAASIFVVYLATLLGFFILILFSTSETSVFFLYVLGLMPLMCLPIPAVSQKLQRQRVG